MNKKYNIIYADPAWTFKVYSNKGKGRSAENHYKIYTSTHSKSSNQCKQPNLFCNHTYKNYGEQKSR